MTETLYLPGEALRILVVDDAVANQEILRAILENEGYEIHTAGNGKTGAWSAGTNQRGQTTENQPDLLHGWTMVLGGLTR